MSKRPSFLHFSYARQHELQDEIRRNRARFRRHTKPYLRSVLCPCTRPWNLEPDLQLHTQRGFWKDVNSLALLDALAPLDPALCGDLAGGGRTTVRREEQSPLAHGYFDGIEVAVGVPEWSTVANALRALGYRVEQTAHGVEGEGNFIVVVRSRRASDAPLDAAKLREMMLARHPRKAIVLYADYANWRR